MTLNDELVRIKSEVAEICIKSMYGLSVKEFVDKVIFKDLDKGESF